MKFKFVDFIPEDLDQGVLYVSAAYCVASHLCCCGCKREVVTPLSPTDWKLIFDGKSVSLTPSIGNWAFKCRSHYWIDKGQVIWAENWSHQRIKSVRQHNRVLKGKEKSQEARKSKMDRLEKLWRKIFKWW